MNRRSILGVIGAVVASVVITGSALAAGPVFANGSFETGTYTQYPGWDFDRVAANGPQDIAGWTVTMGNVDWTGDGLWQAADGHKSIDLDGAENTAGAISQTFNTVINGTYVVTFGLSGNPGNPEVTGNVPNKTGTVDAAGTTDPFSFDTTGHSYSNMGWETRTFTFVAKASSTTLTFTSTTGTGWGPVIDNVVITETLPTGAQCKKGGWQTMTDKYGTAFRNQGDCVSYYATGEKNLAY